MGGLFAKCHQEDTAKRDVKLNISMHGCHGALRNVLVCLPKNGLNTTLNLR